MQQIRKMMIMTSRDKKYIRMHEHQKHAHKQTGSVTSIKKIQIQDDK